MTMRSDVRSLQATAPSALTLVPFFCFWQAGDQMQLAVFFSPFFFFFFFFGACVAPVEQNKTRNHHKKKTHTHTHTTHNARAPALSDVENNTQTNLEEASNRGKQEQARQHSVVLAVDQVTGPGRAHHDRHILARRRARLLTVLHGDAQSWMFKPNQCTAEQGAFGKESYRLSTPR
jgi:hypothetical protein